ncbi:MAG: exopolysaccharide biosynthesis polyprenyl glycosylphosphotransferase [Planctomycetota bacterium]
MPAPVTAGAGPTTLSITPFVPARVRVRGSVAPWTERCVRLAGRALAGMPPSSWLLIDLAFLTVAVFSAYIVFPPIPNLEVPHVALWQAEMIFAFVTIVASLVFGLYERETVLTRSRTLMRMLLTASLSVVLAYAIIYVIMYSTVSRRVAGLALTVFVTGGVGIRLLACWATYKIRRGLLVVGSPNLFESFSRAQEEGFLREYRLVGHAAAVNAEADSEGDRHYVGPIREQVHRLNELDVSDIVVSASAAREPRVMDWIIPGLQAGCRVTSEAIFYEKAAGQILVDEITPYWFLFADLKVHCDERATLKRVFDLFVAAVGLIVTGPFWPLIALVVRLGDRGPVFYSQDRVGQNGEVFRLYKFRTMRTDAENGRSIWASRNDPRVTKVGRWLRRSRLDELPQLYNVLVGQMSIVGPRPERPDIVETLAAELPYYNERHLVKPGISGWAQISFRYGSSVADAKRKLQFDLYYLKHMSFELDMIILLRTLGTFLRGAC